MNKMLLSAGLLLSFFSCYAQEFDTEDKSTPVDSEVSVNTNNIKYVTFQSVNAIDPGSSPIPSNGKDDFLKELSPSYLNVYPREGNASSGWFLSVQGGVSAFVGDPIGCEDLFGRIKPTLKAEIGKWISPTFGTRLQYQGFDLKSGDLNIHKYNAAHVDFLWDLLSSNHLENDEPRFALVPFLGCGIIQNKETDTHPFSLHYGLLGSIRISRHFDMNLEIGCINTFKNFDGSGSRHQLGDQLLNASIGLCYKLKSKYSHRRVIDAVPYIEQNNALLAALKQSKNENRLLSEDLTRKDRVLNEFKKIIEIKGRLAKALKDAEIDNGTHAIGYPYNNYSGLNALRRRLSEDLVSPEVSDEDSQNPKRLANYSSVDSCLSDSVRTSIPSASNNTEDDSESYLALLLGNKVCIGAPILFFFELNSANLTDRAQIANIKEIAQIVNDYNLKITVTGSADSATGNDSINQKLSSIRADFIIEEFVKMGVVRTSINKETLGGINKYAPTEANRNTCVRLFL